MVRIQTRRVFRRRRSIRRARDRFEVLEGRRVLASYFVDTNIDIDTRICAPDNAAAISSVRFASQSWRPKTVPDLIRSGYRMGRISSMPSRLEVSM